MIPSLADTKRFWSHVDRTSPLGCWPWIASKHRNGYGAFSTSRDGRVRHWRAHRFARLLGHGRFDEALLVCHRCDNPSCCNPGHLFLGSHADNIRDCARKGRLNRPRGERHSQAKLTWSVVRVIRESADPGVTLARRFGITNTMITRIRKGRAWSTDPNDVGGASGGQST